MSHPRFFLRALALLGLCGASACTSSTETGTPEGVARVAITALDTEVEGQGLDLSAAWLSLRELSFIPCDLNAAPLGTTDFPVNLFVTPPSSLELDSGVLDYCGLRVVLGPSHIDHPTGFKDRTALIDGERSDGTPFELSSTLNSELVFTSSPEGTPFDAQKLVLGIDLDQWFTDADVHGAEVTDGVALIDDVHNPDVLAAFDAATSMALSLYVDSDGDGTLTGDELVPVATRTAP